MPKNGYNMAEFNTPTTQAQWQQMDAQSVWHPFTQVATAPSNVVLTRGQGACFYDVEGHKYIDGIASWWVNLHGHCHPYIIAAITQQLQQLEHALFAGFTHQPGITLANRLLQHLPSQDKVFFSDNGSTAVEVALKMALQYAHNIGQPKYKVIAFEDAYHGDTFGGMSVAARNAFNAPFQPLLFDVLSLPLPTHSNLDAVVQQLEGYLKKGDVACFIFEPLVLGAGGMLLYEPAHLDALLQCCAKYECITIADEVMTGFGRTGTFFASQQLSIQPDVVCMSKGITGGFFPLGATACKAFIYNAFLSDDKYKTFFHGHSYTGNPVTCAAALASLDLMEQDSTWQAIAAIEQAHAQAAQLLRRSSKVSQVRHKGTILAFDLVSEEHTHYLNNQAAYIAQFFMDRNIILRPLGNVVYVLPPYCITQEELQQIYAAMLELAGVG